MQFKYINLKVDLIELMQNLEAKNLFRWLPIQLLLLHFRSHQLLLLFWALIILTINDSFAASYGASSLFLAPRYLNDVNGLSYLYLGLGYGLFILAWEITTFILHHYRLPFLVYSRKVFLEFTLNNSLIPLGVTLLFIYRIIRFLSKEEGKSIITILVGVLSFLAGMLVMFLLAYLYFSKVERGLIKSSFQRIINPKKRKWSFLYTTNREGAMINATTFISLKGWFTPVPIKRVNVHRILQIIINRQQANAVMAVAVAFFILLVVGFFIDYPIFQIPAGVGILLLLSMLLAGTGMLSYFWKSWTLMGWLGLLVIGMLLVKSNWLDFRSHVPNLDYYYSDLPSYQYESLKNVFSEQVYWEDLKNEENRLRNRFNEQGRQKSPLVLISISGGGSRSMYWSFRALQYVDSLTEGALFQQTILITGASGGMIGGAYWRNLHADFLNVPTFKYQEKYQENMGADFLNPVILGLVTLDVISPFNKLNWSGWRRGRDRGWIFEQTLDIETEGVLSGPLDKYIDLENTGQIPLLIPYATLLNDGRKIYFPSRSMSFFSRSQYDLKSDYPPIDAIDAHHFFQHQSIDKMSINSALRMSASFPGVLPVVHLPSQPKMKVLDAGIRDNYGVEIIVRYLMSLEQVIKEVASEVIVLQIRDTREHWPYISSEPPSLGSIFAPVFTIQKNWNAFQTFRKTYIEELAQQELGRDHFKILNLAYAPEESEKAAPLNFFLTQKQKESILKALYHPNNKKTFQELMNSLNPRNNIVL